MNSKNKINQRIIFKKFKIKKLIYKSSLNSVYEGVNIINNTPVALKMEKIKQFNLLESEAFSLMNLKGFGIPKLISYGKKGTYSILIEELLGPNLEVLWEKFGYDKSILLKKILKDICMIAIQLIERIKYIHSKNIIHHDIKPTNFTIGRHDPNNLYLIDFGFARKYKSSRTGKHIKFNIIKKLAGSFYFSSNNALIGYELSRRDDLESLGYTLLYLARGLWLPWLELLIEDTEELYSGIKKMRFEISDEKLCEGLPIEFISYFKYVKNLKFEEEPNYQYLNDLFLSVLSKNQMINDLHFFWIIKPKKHIFSKEKKNVLKIDSDLTFKKLNSGNVERKNSFHKRLYNKIKISLNKNNIDMDLSLNSDNSRNNSIKNSEYEIYKNNTINYSKKIKLINYRNLDNNKNIATSINNNVKYRKLNDEISNLKLNTFKSKYKKFERTKIRYIPQLINEIIETNKTIELYTRIQIYNNITYNKLNIINKNPIKKYSFLKSCGNSKEKINKKYSMPGKAKLYKSIFKK